MTRAVHILLRSVLFLTFLVLVDRGLGGLLAGIVASTEAGKRTDPLAALRDEDPEFLILGNSRARCHYNPRFFESAFGMRVFNAGCEGQLMPYTRGMLDLALKECNPRICLIDVDPKSLLHDAGGYGGVALLAGHLHRSSVVEALLGEVGPSARLRYLSSAARYNRVAPELLANLVWSGRTCHGYTGITRTASLEQLEHAVAPGGTVAPPSPRMLAMLEECVRAAEASGAWVALAGSPYWRKGFMPDPRYRPAMKEVDALAERLGVPFLETTQQDNLAFRDPTLFADDYHLNRRGANVYSALVAEWLRRVYMRSDIESLLRHGSFKTGK